MKNIETKFYSQDWQEKSFKKFIITYICFAAIRTILYLTLGISISNNIVIGDTYFFYQDIITVFELLFMAFVYLALLIASVVILASCLNIVSDLDESCDIKKRLHLYLIPMLLDIFGGLIFASIIMLKHIALILGIVISLIEIGLFIWLIFSAKRNN